VLEPFLLPLCQLRQARELPRQILSVPAPSSLPSWLLLSPFPELSFLPAALIFQFEELPTFLIILKS
jgi:hypothetical protein